LAAENLNGLRQRIADVGQFDRDVPDAVLRLLNHRDLPDARKGLEQRGSARGRPFHLQVQRGSLLLGTLQSLGCVQRNNAPPVDDADPLAQLISFFHIVRRQDDRLALVAVKPPDEVSGVPRSAPRRCAGGPAPDRGRRRTPTPAPSRPWEQAACTGSGWSWSSRRRSARASRTTPRGGFAG